MNRRTILVAVLVLAVLELCALMFAIHLRPSSGQTPETESTASTGAADHTPLTALETESAPTNDRSATNPGLSRAPNPDAPAPGDRGDPELADATWIAGRVEFAPGTPLDEQIEIVAVGHKFEHRPLVKAVVHSDGRFRVAFSKGTRKGWLSMQARFSYLDASPPIDMAKPPEEVVLRPKLGGCLRGRILLDARGQAHAADVVAAAMTVGTSAETAGEFSAVQGRIAPDLTYEAGGLIPDVPLTVWIGARGFVSLSVEVANVTRGEITTRDLALELGTRITGRVVDEGGAVLAGAKMGVLCGQSRTNLWGNMTSAANGAFELVGLPGGKIEILAQKPAFAPTRSDLGELPLGTDRAGVDVVLARGLHVAGKVQWPDGRPADQSLVDVREAAGADEDFEAMLEPRTPTQTAEDGSFRVTGLRNAPFVVIARAWVDPDAPVAKPEPPKSVEAAAQKPSKVRMRGTPWSVRVEGIAADTDGLVLTLAKGATIRGRAIDQDDKPYERFSVTARPIPGSDDPSRDLSPISKSFRDKDGRFALEGLQTGGWDVVVKSRGALESPAQRITVPGANDALEFRLLRNASIAGTVVDSSGQPIAGARVIASGGTGDSPRTARTHAKGEFTLDDAPLGPVEVAAEADGFARSAPVELELTASQSVADVQLRLRVGATLVVQLLGVDGAPVPPGTSGGIRVQDAREGNAPSPAKQDADGASVYEHLAPGRWIVTAQPNPLHVPNQSIDRDGSSIPMVPAEVVQLADGQQLRVVLSATIGTRSRLVGKVVASRAGVSLSGWVTAVRVRGADEESTRFGDIKEDGTFTLVLGAPGEFLVTARTSENGVRVSERLTVVAGDNEHDFALPSGRITGRVIDSAGKPAANVTLTLSGGPRDAASVTEGPRTTESGADGAFAFEALPAGRFAIDARGRDMDFGTEAAVHGCARRTGIDVADGASVEGVELRFLSGATVAGNIRGANGGLMPDVSVYAFDAGGALVRSDVTFTSDHSGHYSIENLPPGRVLLYACTPHSAGKGAVLARGDDTVQLDIAIATAGEIRASAQDAAGAPIVAAFELVDDEGRRFDEVMEFASETSAMLLGRTFTSLPAGKYVVRAFTGDASIGSRSVQVAAGERVDVVLRKAD